MAQFDFAEDDELTDGELSEVLAGLAHSVDDPYAPLASPRVPSAAMQEFESCRFIGGRWQPWWASRRRPL